MAAKRIGALLLIVLAALFLFGFFSSAARTTWFVATAEVYSATVSGYRTVQRDPERPPLYVALLAYQNNGKDVIASNNESSRGKPYALGEQLTIYASSTTPDRVIIKDLASLVSTPLFSLVMAYLFAWGSGVIYRSNRARAEQQSTSKVDAFYARYGHYLKPTTLLLVLILVPLLALISIFVFLAQNLSPSLRRGRRDADALVKALEDVGFFSLEHLPLPLPAFKKHVRDSQTLHLGNYRVCDSGSGAFSARVLSLAGWFARRGINLNVRKGTQPGELNYGTDGVLRLQGLDGTNDVDSRQVDLALARLFNRLLERQDRPERLYVPFPYGDMTMLSEDIYQVLCHSPSFPRERLPLEVGTQGHRDIQLLAKAQEHPLAWRYHRLFKVDADTLGGLAQIANSAPLLRRLHAAGMRFGKVIGQTDQSTLLTVKAADADENTPPLLLLYALASEAYSCCRDVPDLDRLHFKPSEGLQLPVPNQLAANDRLVFSENGSEIDILELDTHARHCLAEKAACRSYMGMTLDESGRWLLYWYVDEDVDFPNMCLHDLLNRKNIQLDCAPLIDYRFDTLCWQRAPVAFTVRNQLTETHEAWQINVANRGLRPLLENEATEQPA
ncbi:hypothetical protein EA797_21105 [Stutzerimonas zhaodongensis]|uniref:DUF3592 domain-containing protein n=1 Tax=Stutzerimonas zhaodongensis TaxID=1176257 RepID=A0A3M2HGP1_9GAMM|nr:DUF3592 domain-containing protein [Stutzerimonas zhaodongensis]MCQ4317776.1 DUF3592 domain-containing protein [Stutzerimonas zhaodongensis]RMH87595.1 hypothetical protein EA797_21105 [Stutzerimonas zhaodongensis]